MKNLCRTSVSQRSHLNYRDEEREHFVETWVEAAHPVELGIKQVDLGGLAKKQKDFEKQEKGLEDSRDPIDFDEDQTNSETLLKLGQYMTQLKQIDPPQIMLADEEMTPQTCS